MKKNISINISGIIFHIEEDGYEQLRRYLDSINRYFASFEDSSEIVADIENRIAEIFLARLSDNKQVITEEDVDQLIATMGSVKDFQAIEEIEEGAGQQAYTEESFDEEAGATAGATAGEGAGEGTGAAAGAGTGQTTTKKLYRNNKSKLIGGVASGIAHYFNLDPLWIRLAFIILFFDVFATQSVSTVSFLAYIILWIVLPGSNDLEEDKQLKKMFRDPEDNVLGGVASGIAAYFGIDKTLVRVLFVVAVAAFGTGLIAYIILWIIIPQAKTTTDKLKMQGEPVTLQNIENNVRKGLNVKPEDSENTLVKILLFPFRVIATVFEWLGKAIGPVLRAIAEVIRFGVGLLIMLMGVAILIGLLSLVVLALNPDANLFYAMRSDIPLSVIGSVVPPILIVSVVLFQLATAVGLFTIGASILAKRQIMSGRVAWVVFGIWLLSIIAGGASVPLVLSEFSEESSRTEEQYYDLQGSTPILRLNNHDFDRYNYLMKVYLASTVQDRIRIEKEVSAFGPTQAQALENSYNADIETSLKDSVFTINGKLQYKDDVPFNRYRGVATVFIPQNQPFVMSYEMLREVNIMGKRQRFITNKQEQTYRFNSAGQLECISCPPPPANAPANAPTQYRQGERKARELTTDTFSVVQLDNRRLDIDRLDGAYKTWCSGVYPFVDSVKYQVANDTLFINTNQLSNQQLRGMKIYVQRPDGLPNVRVAYKE